MKSEDYKALADALRRRRHPTGAWYTIGTVLAEEVIKALERAAREAKKNENR